LAVDFHEVFKQLILLEPLNCSGFRAQAGACRERLNRKI
jgi:hypothetical protein